MTSVPFIPLLLLLSGWTLHNYVEGNSWQEIRFCHENSGMSGIRRCHNEKTSQTFLSVTGGKIKDIRQLQPMTNFNLTAPGVEICTNGVWALYTEINYQKGYYGSIGSGELCYACPPDQDQDTCSDNFGTKSARYLGNLNSNLPGLSLFPGDGTSLWPSGEETYIDGSLRQLSFESPLCVTFWAYTSSTSWTIFSKSNFTGESACLMPLKTLNGSTLPYGWGELHYIFVGSVRVGCDPLITHLVQGADETMLTVHEDGSIIQESTDSDDEDLSYGLDPQKHLPQFSNCRRSFVASTSKHTGGVSRVQNCLQIILIMFSILYLF